MKNDALYNAPSSIYPGTYVPLIDQEVMQEHLKKTHHDKAAFPPVNVSELADTIKIEIAIPGAKREDFFITADKNVLSVCVIDNQAKLSVDEKFKLHEFNHGYFNRHIFLPENTDSQFISAEYKEGMLSLYVSKSNNPVRNHHTRIVVY